MSTKMFLFKIMISTQFEKLGRYKADASDLSFSATILTFLSSVVSKKLFTFLT